MTQARPPKWANRFLEWYCNPSLLEEIQGDAHELFYRTASKSESKARWQFVWNVVRFFRLRNIRKTKPGRNTSIRFDMLKSYFITGLRTMVRNATPSLINIVGLSVAIGCAVMIFILEDSYYNLDAMHKEGDRIALIVSYVKEGDDIEKWARAPHSLADLLKENSAVEKAPRAGRGSAAVRVGDKVFSEGLLYADPDFLNVFSFNIVSGNRQALSNKNQLMLTQEMAIKYFGNEDVVGQPVSLKFSDKYKQEFTVGAVLEDIPANSSMYFNFLVPSSVWEEMNKNLLEDWSKNTSVTFVLLKEGHSISQLQPTFDAYKKFQNDANTVHPVVRTEGLLLPDVAQQSFEISGSLSWSNAPAAMIAFAVIAVFLLLLACFNYMNVAVASVSTRLKEIGVRKVIGGGKKEIIQQFLVENIVMCSIALLGGTLLAYYILVPAFDSLFPIKLVFEVSSWKIVLTFFGGLLLFVALVSGAYPALYVSSFSAVKILRGKEKFGSKSNFSKILLTSQFILSITTIVGCLVFVWASLYFEEKDWGYNQENTMWVRIQNARQFEEFRNVLISDKNVISFAGSQQQVGKSSLPSVVRYHEQEYPVSNFPVGFEYLESMNIRLKTGRFFREASESDKGESVIVNEAFVKKMGWASPLDESIEVDSIKRYVVGVVEDFYYHDFFMPVEPAIFTITTAENFRYVVVKTAAGSSVVVFEKLKNTWRQIASDDPFNGFMQNEVFDQFFNGNRANNKVIFFISGVSVLLAAMGLYGLVSYNLTRRLKEFSVRKVFGANVLELFRLMNRDYFWIVVIAFSVGAPLGAYLVDLLLKAAYPLAIPINGSPYFISISVMILTVALTIGSQLRRVIKENPAQTLRME